MAGVDMEYWFSAHEMAVLARIVAEEEKHLRMVKDVLSKV